ncbi:MAG TPA: helix-turn-helix domain-containing protein [Acidimicrobiales bacterium]|nr:helix-turn-helix domain-containing protein [Acidimicrobiales bacterium]
MAAAYACVARDGMGRATVEDIAREAGVARATVYRAFPGGRDELVTAAVAHAVRDFFAGLRADIGEVHDVVTLLERGLVAGRRRLDQHAVLQRSLRDEADRVVPELATVMPVVLDALRAQLAAWLARERLRPGVEVDEAADLVARLTLSLISSPGGWDMDDPGAVRRLVRGQLLAGVVDRDDLDDGHAGDAG